jgi:hypothetical protein
VKSKILHFLSRYSAWRWAGIILTICFFGNLLLALRDEPLKERSALAYAAPLIPAEKNAFSRVKNHAAFVNLNSELDSFSKSRVARSPQEFLNQKSEAYQILHEILANQQIIIGSDSPEIFKIIRFEASHLEQQGNYEEALKLMIDLDQYLSRMMNYQHSKIYTLESECQLNAQLMSKTLSKSIDVKLISKIINIKRTEEDWINLHLNTIKRNNQEFERSLEKAMNNDYDNKYFWCIDPKFRICNGIFLKKNKTLNLQIDYATDLINLAKTKKGYLSEMLYIQQYTQHLDSLPYKTFNSLRKLNANGFMATNEWYLDQLMSSTLKARTTDQELKIIAALRLHELELGRLPEKLEDLVPAYLPEVPLNPINGQAFIYSAKERRIYGIDARCTQSVIGTSLGLGEAPASSTPSAKSPVSSAPPQPAP